MNQSVRSLRELLCCATAEAARAGQYLQREESLCFLERAVELLEGCFRRGNKLIVAGNGGSLCDAAHFAEELTGFFRKPRPPLPAIVLGDAGHITCVANDLGYEHVFARSIEALGQPGDVFVALTTSGNSMNLVHAVSAAQQKGLTTILFLGKEGGRLRGTGDLEFLVSGFPYSDRIQEVHMAAIHIVIEGLEQRLFSSEEAPRTLAVDALALLSR